MTGELWALVQFLLRQLVDGPITTIDERHFTHLVKINIWPCTFKKVCCTFSYKLKSMFGQLNIRDRSLYRGSHYKVLCKRKLRLIDVIILI